MQVLLPISSVLQVPTEGIYHTDNQNTWLNSICGAYEKKLNCKRNFQFISTAVSLSQYRYSQNQSKQRFKKPMPSCKSIWCSKRVILQGVRVIDFRHMLLACKINFQIMLINKVINIGECMPSVKFRIPHLMHGIWLELCQRVNVTKQFTSFINNVRKS